MDNYRLAGYIAGLLVGLVVQVCLYYVWLHRVSPSKSTQERVRHVGSVVVFALVLGSLIYATEVRIVHVDDDAPALESKSKMKELCADIMERCISEE